MCGLLLVPCPSSTGPCTIDVLSMLILPSRKSAEYCSPLPVALAVGEGLDEVALVAAGSAPPGLGTTHAKHPEGQATSETENGQPNTAGNDHPGGRPLAARTRRGNVTLHGTSLTRHLRPTGRDARASLICSTDHHRRRAGAWT